MHLHLNPLGGLAGDMFCAALLDARPDLLPRVEAAVADLAMPRAVQIDLMDADSPIGGRRFRVQPAGPAPHRHTTYTDIRALLQGAALEPGVRRRALDLFARLARAEAQVHGVDPERASFHEVGAWDSIADVVAAAVLLDALDVTSASCDPLPLGGGRVPSAHGVLPLPAPATVLLLQGLPVTDDGIPGERVTPTGAAILRSLQAGPERLAQGRLAGSGLGFGARALEGIPNCLQVLCIAHRPAVDAAPAGYRPLLDRVATLAFEVDDQTPEDFALALERLRATAGVLSVTNTAATGKAGRPTMAVQVLARPERLGQVAETCFRETATIGLRWSESARLVLEREQVQVQAEGRTLEVKRVLRPDGPSAKVECRDLAAQAGYLARERLRQAGARAALETDRE
jgi:uncharacterized protein (TIGR00299 family) protein